MIGHCFECGEDFLGTDRWEDLCPRCVAVELADLKADELFYPQSRVEQMRERLGVSGNVDE